MFTKYLLLFLTNSVYSLSVNNYLSNMTDIEYFSSWIAFVIQIFSNLYRILVN